MSIDAVVALADHDLVEEWLSIYTVFNTSQECFHDSTPANSRY